MAFLDSVSLFISDWDETITTADSMHLIGDAAYDHKPEFEPEWSFFANAYLDDYRAHQRDFEEQYGHLEGLDREIKFQTQMAGIEQKSIDRVEQSGLFEGVPVDKIRRQSTHVSTRTGWWDLMAELKRKGIPVAIVSVNWSGELIRHVFEAHGYSTKEGGDVAVYANEIIEKNGVATGKLSREYQADCKLNDLRTGCDKQRLVRHLRTEAPGAVCYCGDSGTDILGLLEADFGIIVSKRGLLDKLTAFGLDIHEQDGALTGVSAQNSRNQLFYVQDWTSLLSPSSS